MFLTLGIRYQCVFCRTINAFDYGMLLQALPGWQSHAPPFLKSEQAFSSEPIVPKKSLVRPYGSYNTVLVLESDFFLGPNPGRANH